MSKSKNRAKEESCNCNVGEAERVASAVVGGVLVFKGLKSGSLFGVASALIGAAGLYRAATGYCPLYTALDVNTNTAGQKLSNVAEHAKELASTVAEGAKQYADAGLEKAQDLSNGARNKIAEAIAVK